MKILRKIKLWIIERAISGQAWDLFLLGLLGLVALTLISMVIGYVK